MQYASPLVVCNELMNELINSLSSFKVHMQSYMEDINYKSMWISLSLSLRCVLEKMCAFMQ